MRKGSFSGVVIVICPACDEEVNHEPAHDELLLCEECEEEFEPPTRLEIAEEITG